MKTVAAILLCDRKRHFMLTALPALFDESLIDSIYINIETEFNNLRFVYHPLLEFLKSQTKPYDYDAWSVSHSTWRIRPQYDQHQVRLAPITMARNMAIDYALSKGATHLLFVDSDVVIHPNGLEKLLALDVPLCGGFVPGRGAHSHVHYIFGAKRGIQENGPIMTCDHGTCGYMLIRREVFSVLRFRWGTDREQPDQLLSEDPAFCLDWYLMSGHRFLIHKEATADHLDNPTHPLTEAETAKDNWNEVQS